MPGGVIADPQRPAELNSRNTPLIGNAKIDCPKPYGQGQMGSVHHRSGCDGGLAAAGTTLAEVPASNDGKLFASTLRTHEALGKSLAKQFLPARFFCVIPPPKFFETDGCRLCHLNILRSFS